MIEDKTKEPQTAEPAQQPPKKRGQKLRSLWAQFQCMQLLRRHRFRRRTQHHVNHFSQKLLQNRLVLIVGEALYALGFSAEYAFVRVGRTVCRGVSGALLWGRSLLHTIVSMAFPGAAQMVRALERVFIAVDDDDAARIDAAFDQFMDRFAAGFAEPAHDNMVL